MLFTIRLTSRGVDNQEDGGHETEAENGGG